MPTPALMSYRLKSLLIKSETTYGTDAVPVAATNGVLAMNMTINVTADKLERPIDRAYFTANPFVLVNKRVEIEFDFEPFGSSTVGNAAPCGPILTSCAMSETLLATTSATYAPSSTSLKSVSIYFNIAGQQVAVLGARGSVSFDFTIKQFPKAHAKFTGQFAIPTSVALTAPTLTSWQTPVAVEMETMLVSVGGTALNATSVTLDMANDVKIHEGSELRSIDIMQRGPSGTIKCFDPAIANMDLWTPAKNYTLQALICSVTGPAGKIVTLNVPNAQLEFPKWSEMDGAVGLEIPFVALPSTAGNDEMSLVFT